MASTLRGMAACLAAALGACSGSSGRGAGDAGTGGDSGPADATPFDPCDPLGDRPGVCPARGVYDGPIQVELRAPLGAEVYYTLDGSEPDEATGIRYGEPIDVAPPADRGVVVLRARAIDPASGARSIVTHS